VDDPAGGDELLDDGVFEVEDFEEDELLLVSDVTELVVFGGSLLVFGGFCDDFEVDVLVSGLGTEYVTEGDGVLVVWLLFTFDGPVGCSLCPLLAAIR
jgi:hypothetical protein